MRYCIFVLLLLLGAYLQGQDFPDRVRCALHTNQPFYVTGEVVRYCLYLPPVLSNQPIKVRTSLLDPSGTVVHTAFLSSEGRNWVAGYYIIPFDLPSAGYRLLFSAFDGERAHVLLQAHLPIYNDLASIDTKTITLAEFQEAPPVGMAGVTPLVSINLETPTPTPGGKVRARVRLNHPDSHLPLANKAFSLAVADADMLPSTGQIKTIAPMLSLVTLAKLQNQVYYSGILHDSIGRTISSGLLGAWDVERQQFYFTRADETGHFILNLPDYSGARRIQFIDLDRTGISITFDAEQALSAPEQLTYSAPILRYMDLSRQRKKIYQLYNRLENAAMPVPDTVAPRAFMADKSFRFADYTSFSNAATFFQEVANTLRFNRRRDGYQARMYNPQLKDNFPSTPLFVVDGKVTRNADYIAALKPTDLARVDLFFRPTLLRDYFPAFGSSGAALIISNNGKLLLPAGEEKNIFSLYGLQPALVEDKATSDAPRLSPGVFWAAGLTTNAQGEAFIEFDASDDRSNFRVEAYSQAANGQCEWARGYYKTK